MKVKKEEPAKGTNKEGKELAIVCLRGLAGAEAEKDNGKSPLHLTA